MFDTKNFKNEKYLNLILKLHSKLIFIYFDIQYYMIIYYILFFRNIEF